MTERQRLSLALAVNAFGSALTYTGLPTWVALRTGDAAHASGLFLAETGASLALGLVGGALADGGSRRRISALANALSAFALVALIATLGLGQTWTFYAAGVLIGALGALASSAESAWFAAAVDGSQAERQVASRSAATMAAKLAGMGLGPLAFHALGAWALALDAATFVAVAALLAAAPRTAASEGSGNASPRGWGELARGYRAACEGTLLPIAASLLAGLLTTPLMSAATQVIHRRFDGDAELISALWLAGAVGSLASNSVASRTGVPARRTAAVAVVAASVMAAALSLMGLATEGLAFVLPLAGFTLANPWLTISTQAELIRRSSRDHLGRVMALQGIAVDLAAIGGVWAYFGLGLENLGAKAVWAFLPIALARGAMVAGMAGGRSGGSRCAGSA